MDLAALSLEDSFPDLTPQQVRDALAQANGDLALAEQLCHRLLGAAEAGPALQPAQQQHRQWWPPAPAPADSLPGLAEERNPGSTAVYSGTQPTSLPGAQSSQPAVRVLQHHGRTANGSNSSSSGSNGLLLGGAAGEAQAKGSEEGIHYAAVFLSDSSRDRMLQFAPPLHEAVSADHLTMAYRPSLEACLELPLGREAQLFVEGLASDYRAQALAVQFPSWLPYLSDAAPHVTVSVAEGVPTREAGDLIRAARKGQRARIVPLVSMKLLHGTVGVKLTDGSIAYSEEELKEGLMRLQRQAPPISQGGPVRILKRGEATPPPSQQQQQQQRAPAAAAPAAAARRVSFGGVEARSPQPPAGFAPGPAQQQQQQQQQRIAAPPPAAVAPTISEAAPTLDDLLDMLYLEDTAAAAGSAAAPAAPAPSRTPQQQQRRQQPRPMPPGKQPDRDHAQRSVPQRQPLHQPPSQQLQAPAPGASLGFGALQPPPAAEVEGDDGGPLDMLSSLAERLASGGQAPAPQQQAVSPPSPTSVPPPFSALPLFRHALPQPPLGAPSVGKPPGPAPARTLGDFLPGPLAGGSGGPGSAAAAPPPPLPFFLDAPAAGPPPPAFSSAAAAGGGRGQQQQQQAAGGSRPLRRQTSGAAPSVGGYESSSSSGADGRSEWESGVGGGAGLYASSSAALPGIQTEADLQQAFPFVEAEVLSAALEIHGGDAAEAASFLAALEMNHQDQGLIEGSGPDLGTQSLPHHQQQQRSQQSRLLQQGGGGGGQRRPGARPGSGITGGGRGRGRSHTGASDPLAVAERQAMSLHFAAKNIYEKAARAAAARGAHALSKELSATSRHHADLGSAARRRANSTAYRTSNSGVTNTFKVDLHGLHVEEALQVLERHLVSLGGLGHPGGIILEVITGVGRHSSAGQPRLLPAVVRYLADAGYRFDTREGNTGVVDVFLGC